jgi:hypothetical protein
VRYGAGRREKGGAFVVSDEEVSRRLQFLSSAPSQLQAMGQKARSLKAKDGGFLVTNMPKIPRDKFVRAGISVVGPIATVCSFILLVLCSYSLLWSFYVDYAVGAANTDVVAKFSKAEGENQRLFIGLWASIVIMTVCTLSTVLYSKHWSKQHYLPVMKTTALPEFVRSARTAHDSVIMLFSVALFVTVCLLLLPYFTLQATSPSLIQYHQGRILHLARGGSVLSDGKCLARAQTSLPSQLLLEACETDNYGQQFRNTGKIKNLYENVCLIGNSTSKTVEFNKCDANSLEAEWEYLGGAKGSGALQLKGTGLCLDVLGNHSALHATRTDVVLSESSCELDNFFFVDFFYNKKALQILGALFAFLVLLVAENSEKNFFISAENLAIPLSKVQKYQMRAWQFREYNNNKIGILWDLTQDE